jgi:hypothetical protein
LANGKSLEDFAVAPVQVWSTKGPKTALF